MSNTDNDYVLIIEGAVMYGFTGTKCVQFALQVSTSKILPVKNSYVHNPMYVHCVCESFVKFAL